MPTLTITTLAGAERQFGLVTNGDEMLLVKVERGDRPQYAVSRVFSPFASGQELSIALQSLKAIAAIVQINYS